MGLKLVVDTIEGLDENVAKLYIKQADGKFKLDADDVPDVTKLTKALKTERDAREAAERSAKQFEGLDVEEIRKLLANVEDDEDAKLLKEGKPGLDKIIARKTDKLTKDAEKRIKDASERATAAESRAKKWLTKVLDNAIRTAAAPLLHPYAIDDALLHARQLFSLDDDGNAVQLDEDGKPVLGKDGKTPFTPTEWLESMRDVRPHWYPATASGSGSRQSSGNGAGKTMKRSAFDALPPKERSRVMREGYQLTD